MNYRTLLIGFIALLPTVACGATHQDCTYTATTQTDKTTGDYNYTVASGGAAGAGDTTHGTAGAAPCVSTSRGEIGTSNPPVITVRDSTSLEISGQIEDASGRPLAFIATVSGLAAAGRGTGQGTLGVDGGQFAPMTWTSDMSTLSLDCPPQSSHKGCVLDASGSLSITANGAAWSLTLDFAIERHDSWSEACMQYSSS